jgi:hypothetical protein
MYQWRVLICLIDSNSVRNKVWHVTDGPQNPVAAFVGTFTSTAAGLVTDIRDFGKALDSTPTATTEYPSKNVNSESATESEIDLAKLESSTRKPHKKKTAILDLTGSIVGHTLKAPVALFYNLANGFHNCPAIMLSDRTVRQYPQVTSLSSGVARSGKEFAFGFYDAITGLVTQPYHGYVDGPSRHQSHAMGTLKGFGRGIGGLVLKPCAAVIGLPGYTFKGLEREIERWWQGSDAFLHGEAEILGIAKDQVRNRLEAAAGERTRVQMLWDDAKGAGMGKRIVERRVWQGYRELHESRLGTEAEAAVIEAKILERWDQIVKNEHVKF